VTIGIDISMLVYRGSGVATYTYNLVIALLKFHPEHKYKLFYSSFRRPKNFNYLNEFKSLGAKVYNYYLPPSVLKWLWNKKNFLPIEWLIGKVDAFHSSDFLRPPLLSGTLGITTLHDLTWKIFPEFHTDDIVFAHTRKIQKTIKYQDLILVDSKNTAKDLAACFPDTKLTNIKVVYLGIDERLGPVKDEQKIKTVLNSYHLEYPLDYLIYVGAIEPRKNVDLAIRAFASLASQDKFQEYKFLLIGRAGWKNENIFKLIAELKLKDKVIFVGYVEEQHLATFYSAAKLTLYLSEYEGFGLPPLESLACLTPALCLNNSSLTEVVAPKYLTFKKDPSDLLQNMIKLIQNDVSEAEGKKIKSQFSWQKYADEVISLIISRI